MNARDAGPDVVIGPLRPSDAPRCAQLDRLVFGDDDPWPQDAFRQALAAGHYYIAARVDGHVVGYAGLARAGDQAEVHTVAVDPEYQGRGIGRALLRALLDRATGAEVFLEVRTDNEPAIALYRSEGFAVVGTRRGYYQPSGADAFTMHREPAPEERDNDLASEIRRAWLSRRRMLADGSWHDPSAFDPSGHGRVS